MNIRPITPAEVDQASSPVDPQPMIAAVIVSGKTQRQIVGYLPQAFAGYCERGF